MVVNLKVDHHALVHVPLVIIVHLLQYHPHKYAPNTSILWLHAVTVLKINVMLCRKQLMFRFVCDLSYIALLLSLFLLLLLQDLPSIHEQVYVIKATIVY
jgi:hypothetical protein